MAIIWSEDYATGFEKVDQQHRQLFDDINILEKEIEQKASKQDILRMLVKIKAFALEHFSHEEDCMIKYHCPMASRNVHEHRRFLRNFESLEAKYIRDSSNPYLIRHLHSTVEKWVAYHLGTVDSHLRACAVKRAANSPD